MAMTAESLRGPLHFAIDLKNGLIQHPIRSHLMKGDKSANTVVVALTDGDKAVDLTGVTVTGSFISPLDGAEIPMMGSVDGNKAIVTLIDECYAEDGHFECHIKLTAGNTSRTILSFTGNVLSKGSGAVIDIGNVIPSIDDIIAQYAEMKRVTEDAQAASNSASTAAGKANTAAAKINGMTVSAVKGNDAAATVSEKNGVKHISFTLPKGDKGDKGDVGSIENLSINGKLVDKGNITLTAADVGARSDTWLPSKTDIKTMILGTWDGNTTPDDIPFGISYVAIGNLTDGHGFPVGFSTVFALKDSAHRLFQLLVEKENGRMYIRSANDGTNWGAWKKYLADDDTAGNSSKLDGKTWTELMKEVYPVGSIYMSVDSTSPASRFGGTWEQLKDKFLLGAGSSYSAGSTGGDAAVTLTIDQMPNHRHILRKETTTPSTSFDGYIATSDTEDDVGSGGADGLKRYTTYEGGGKAHNNMPPYLAVYMWKRVS